MLGPAKIRIGVMPGPWLDGPAAGDHFWRFVDLCETTAIDSAGGTKFVLRPLGPPDVGRDWLERLAADLVRAFHAR